MIADVTLCWCGPGQKENLHTTVDVPELTPGPKVYDAARVKLGVLDSNWVGRRFKFRSEDQS